MSHKKQQFLEIMRNNICGPFNVFSYYGEKYFIIFIDDFLCYDYIYLLHEKSQSINKLKVFINKVKR